jgi:hypothetical protein
MQNDVLVHTHGTPAASNWGRDAHSYPAQALQIFFLHFLLKTVFMLHSCSRPPAFVRIAVKGALLQFLILLKLTPVPSFPPWMRWWKYCHQYWYDIYDTGLTALVILQRPPHGCYTTHFSV